MGAEKAAEPKDKPCQRGHFLHLDTISARVAQNECNERPTSIDLFLGVIREEQIEEKCSKHRPSYNITQDREFSLARVWSGKSLQTHRVASRLRGAAQPDLI